MSVMSSVYFTISCTRLDATTAMMSRARTMSVDVVIAS